MEALSQLDVKSPDHVSVITRDGKITISVLKDGASVTLGFPISSAFETTPRLPLQQPEPKLMAVRESQGVTRDRKVFNLADQGNFQDKNKKNTEVVRKDLVKRRERAMRFTSKLDDIKVKEIKLMLSDGEIMERFSSKTHAYMELGKAYGVSHCTIANIHNGIAWKHIKI